MPLRRGDYVKGRKYFVIKILMDTLRKFFKTNSPSQIGINHIKDFRNIEKNSVDTEKLAITVNKVWANGKSEVIKYKED